jgi:hypothetical protein
MFSEDRYPLSRIMLQGADLSPAGARLGEVSPRCRATLLKILDGKLLSL